ncbi:MAG: xylulose kinase [Thermoanaerobacteraceae bacterium]|nr:xylulose kinase [Thermoanaerobacteraceae bacterium]
MGAKYLLGVDIGTAGTKAGLFDLEGRLLAVAYAESYLRYPAPGWVEQDPEDFYRTACITIREVLEKSGLNPRDIAGMAFDGQMAGIMGIDEEWRAVTRYDSWLDVRCQKYVDWLREHYCEKLIATVGTPPSIAHGPKMIWWKEEEPEVYRRIAKFIVPAVYVAGRVCGLRAEQAFEDYTYLHFSGVSDALAGQWSPELLGAFGLSQDKLPQIVKPWRIVGYVTEEGARDTGLAAGTPVAAGVGDTAASFLGAGMVEKGQAVDVAGTASVLAVCVDEFVPDIENKTLIVPRAVQPGLWFAMAYIGGGGLCLRWFRDTWAAAEREEAERSGRDVYDILNEAAAEVPAGSAGLLFIPHLGGRVCPYDSRIRGAWIGFSWNHDKAGFYRSILEAVAYEYGYYLDITRKLFPSLEVKEVRVIGGGARSPLWNQMKADILGIPYVSLEREEVGIWGSALVAGYAVGIYKDLAGVAKELARPAQKFEVNEKAHAHYRPYRGLYRELYAALKGVYDRLDEIARGT